MSIDTSRRSALKVLGSASLAGAALTLSSCSSKEKSPIGGNGRTGVYFDRDSALHDLKGHPESAHRLGAIIERLKKEDLLSYLSFRPSARVTPGVVANFHTKAMVGRVLREGTDFLGKGKYGTYRTKDTLDVALRAAGGMLQVSSDVANGWIDNGFAIVRPPGHQAARNQSDGFSVFNHVAIAAEYLLSKSMKKIAIIDTDAHHGFGTQNFFYENPNVLYISLHQASLWPQTGKIEETGGDKAVGSTVNIPLPEHSGDKVYAQTFQQIVVPVVKRFAPEIILVSAGYDGHWRDYLTNLGLSCRGLADIDRNILSLAKEVCKGKVVYCLEGGYNPQVLATTVRNSLMTFVGRKAVDEHGTSTRPEPDVSGLLSRIKAVQKI